MNATVDVKPAAIKWAVWAAKFGWKALTLTIMSTGDSTEPSKPLETPKAEQNIEPSKTNPKEGIVSTCVSFTDGNGTTADTWAWT